MSKMHLEELRTTLLRNHWFIVQERIVDEYHITAYWDICRPDGKSRLTIAFEGGYDVCGVYKFSFIESFGCHIVESSNIGAYFARKGRSWPNELANFIGQLNELG